MPVPSSSHESGRFARNPGLQRPEAAAVVANTTLVMLMLAIVMIRKMRRVMVTGAGHAADDVEDAKDADGMITIVGIAEELLGKRLP